MLVTLFWLFTILSCGCAAWFGGRDARWASGLFLAAALLSVPAMRMDRTWHDTQLPVMVIDCLHFIAMYVLTLRARTYWPIWMTGFLLVTVLTHVATLIAPAHIPKLYEAMATFWVIPALFAMLVGVAVDRHAGIQQRGRVRSGDARPSESGANPDDPSRASRAWRRRRPA